MAENPDFSNGQNFHVTRNEWVYRAKIGIAAIAIGTLGTSGAVFMKVGGNTAGHIIGGVEELAAFGALGGAIYKSLDQNKPQEVKVALPKPPSENSGRE